MANYTYDNTNVFAKIILKELPCQKVYEDRFSLAFHDKSPQAPVHILILPKLPVVDWFHFVEVASPEQLAGFSRSVNEVLALLDPEEGYRLVSNSGLHGQQQVMHFHMHILAGRMLGSFVGRKSGL